MGSSIESSISSLCSSLSDVLTHADSSSCALSDALSRRPIALESATSAFLQGLDRRVDAAGSDLARLESMAFGTVSFEELLGHCREALGIVSRHAAAAESRLVSFGYVPPDCVEVDLEEEDENTGKMEDGCFGGTSSVLRSGREQIDDDDELFEESMSLKNLGLSDACLATLSSQGEREGESEQIGTWSTVAARSCRRTGDDDFPGSSMKLYKKPESVGDGEKVAKEAEPKPPQKGTDGEGDACQGMIWASKEEYEQLPPYMKTLASWEELLEAISKLNLYFGGDKAQGSVALNQDDVGEIGLGRKGRSYLLILLRLNQLVMETVDGSILYTLRKNDS